MRVLVTGDKGYFGSVLTSRLQDYSGYDIKDGLNLNDLPKLRKAVEDVEAVVHLAAIVGEEACSKVPASAYVVNVFGTWRLLDFAYMAGVKKFVLASTCSVYGNCGEEVVDEEVVPKPWGVYSYSKFMAECYVAWRGYNVLRFGSLYGGELANDSLPEVMRREAKKGHVRVKDSQSWRPLTHVEDAVKAMLFVLEGEGYPKTLNVVGENIRKGDLAKLVAERYGAKVLMGEGKGRSYRVSSKRLLDSGFRFEWDVRRWLIEDSVVGASA